MNQGTPIAVKEEMTLGGVVALADQVDAATTEVEDAWQLFQYGRGDDATTDKAPYSNDKISHATIALHDSIRRLQDLAGDIRAKA